MHLKQREDLKDALTEKFKGRFGHDSTVRGSDERSVASSCIRREVDSFAKTAHVSEGNLGRLERRLLGRARQGGGGGAGGSMVAGSQVGGSLVSGVSAYSAASGASRSRSLVSLGASRVGSDLPPGAVDWSRLDEYASYLHEQDAMRQKLGVHALQKKLKMDLDHQVHEKSYKKQDIQEEERRYHQNSMVELEQWKANEQSRAEDLKSKLAKEKEDRDDQLAYERKLKHEDLQKKHHEEANLVDKMVYEMDAEQKKHTKKKMQTKAAMKKVFVENMEDQAKRQSDLKEQQAREAQSMKEFNRIVNEQEDQRAGEMEARMAKQKALMVKLQANVAQQSASMGDNDAQRAQAQQAEMDRHYFEAEQTKMRRLKQMRLENQNYLIKQMGERDGRKDEDMELETIQAQILSRDTQEYNEIEKEKAINKRLRNFDNRKQIEKQIVFKSSHPTVGMSETEAKLNKPLLHLVHRTLKKRDEEEAEYDA